MKALACEALKAKSLHEMMTEAWEKHCDKDPVTQLLREKKEQESRPPEATAPSWRRMEIVSDDDDDEDSEGVPSLCGSSDSGSDHPEGSDSDLDRDEFAAAGAMEPDGTVVGPWDDWLRYADSLVPDLDVVAASTGEALM